MQVAITNSSTSISNNDVCFLAQAVGDQAVECARAWGVEPISVAFYASLIGLPADDLWICEYVDKLDVDGALAYHSVDALGRPYLRCLPPSDKLDATDLSHEVLETLADPTADRWVRMPDGTEIAVEICDPVQGDSYAVPVTVLGETRQIKLSNYVLGSFFDPQGQAPYDRLGNVRAPFRMSVMGGGYEAQISADGNEHNVFGNRVVAARKQLDLEGRLMRRLRMRRP